MLFGRRWKLWKLGPSWNKQVTVSKTLRITPAPPVLSSPFLLLRAHHELHSLFLYALPLLWGQTQMHRAKGCGEKSPLWKHESNLYCFSVAHFVVICAFVWVTEMRKRSDKTTHITTEMFTTITFIINCLHNEQHLHSNNLLLPKERYANTVLSISQLLVPVSLT